jgi:hypothetical protein
MRAVVKKMFGIEFVMTKNSIKYMDSALVLLKKYSVGYNQKLKSRL